MLPHLTPLSVFHINSFSPTSNSYRALSHPPTSPLLVFPLPHKLPFSRPIHLSPLFPPFSPKAPKLEDLIVLFPHPPTNPQDSLVTMTTELLKAEVKDLVAMASASLPPAQPAHPAALAPAQRAARWISQPGRDGAGLQPGGREEKG